MPIELPRTTAAVKTRRLARSMGRFGRHLAPALARSVTGRANGEPVIARAVRRAFEDLGATYVKFGQFVGSAPDIVGDAVAEEFRSCLDTGPAVPFPRLRSIVEADIGQPLGRAFATFDEQPFAAASIAVVHRATLPDGTAVAVKVLRPEMDEVVAADLALMQAPVRFFAQQGSDRALDLYAYLIGLQQQVAEELDLRNEARSMDYFRSLFADLDLSLLVVPLVYHELSGSRVLTMEFLDGVAIDDLGNIEQRGLDPRPFVRQLMRAWLLTAMYEGIFHADIHAGNLLLTRDGRLGMLDWGIVARLDPDTHKLVRSILEVGLGIESGWDALTAHFIRLQGPALRGGLGLTDEQIAKIVRGVMEPVLTKPVGEVSMATLFGGTDEMLAMVGKAPPQRTLRERWRLIRNTARTNRMRIEQGVPESSFQRASFLAAKQVVYLERYWKEYLPEEALLGDRAFLQAVLSRDGHRPPDA